jgi:tetratricopeptide (TPR) repeat protein
MAMKVIETRLKRGDIAGAAAMVPKIVSPFVFSQLLTEKEFYALRPAVEAWAGSRLEKQWEIYLEQARAEWEASNDLEAGVGYVRALGNAGHDRTLAATFLPLFDRPIDPNRDQDLVFIAPMVASALARLGRWDEAFRLFEKALVAWPEGSWANALNLTTNRARLLFYKGDFKAAVAQLEKDLDNAAKWSGQVHEGAIASMHLYRACALEQLGRGDEAASSSALVTGRKTVNPTRFAFLQLCRNDIGWARQTLLQALESEATRASVIAWMQPSNEETYASDFAKLMHARARQLRTDKELVAAVSKYGRILSEPINAAAPPEKSKPASAEL